MARSSTKAARLLQIESLLAAHPEGLTPAEIARRLDVHRSSVGRYLPDLPKHIFVDDLDGGSQLLLQQVPGLTGLLAPQVSSVPYLCLLIVNPQIHRSVGPPRYDDPVVIVGASEMYEARCREHHQVPKE